MPQRICTFNEAKERAEQNGRELQYGAIANDLAAIQISDRLQYLPVGQLQFNNIMDTNGCASRGPLNILEAKLNYFYDNGMHPALKQWFDQDHMVDGVPVRFRVNGKFALCDAFIEILSGTTRTGNSLKKPLDTICEYGVIPASLIPLEDGMTWDQYMRRTRVTEAHLELGREFKRRITIDIEQVSAALFADAIKDDLLDVALRAWLEPVNGIYPAFPGPFNHVVALATDDIYALDGYQPYLKRLAKDYQFFDWCYSISITNQNPYPDETLAIFEILQRFGLLAFFSAAWSRLVASTPQNTATKPVETPAPARPQKAPLADFCTALRDFEGKPGDLNYRNNNPGNVRCSNVGYHPMYGKVQCINSFARFETYELGWTYLNNLVKQRITKHATWTFYDFFDNYAPAEDHNNPKHYAETVAKRLGLNPNNVLSKVIAV